MVTLLFLIGYYRSELPASDKALIMSGVIGTLKRFLPSEDSSVHIVYLITAPT